MIYIWIKRVTLKQTSHTHLILLCFRHKKCAKLHKQRSLPRNLYWLLSMIFSNNQIWWIWPYYELHHLHYTNWRLYFSRWSPKGDLRLFLISSPALGNFFFTMMPLNFVILAICMSLLGNYFWIDEAVDVQKLSKKEQRRLKKKVIMVIFSNLTLDWVRVISSSSVSSKFYDHWITG